MSVLVLLLLLSTTSASVQEFDWAVQGSGRLYEEGRAVAVDGSGNVYVAGRFWEVATFGAGEPNEESLQSLGVDDVFLAKYDSRGAMLWVRQGGGPGVNHAWGVGVGADGFVYVAGHSSSAITFASGEANQTTLPSLGVWTPFLAKYDTDGGLVWARQASSNGTAITDDLAVDASGNSYVTGRFTGSVAFGSGAPAVVLTSAGGYDVFVAKYDAAGNIAWAQRAGGAQNDDGLGVAVDSSGNPVITGTFAGSATFGQGQANATTLVSSGSWDAFLAAYDWAGVLRWARRDGGADYEEGRDLAIDGDGNSYVTGRFVGASTFGAGETQEMTITSASAQLEDIYVAKHDSSGRLLWVRRAGGTQIDIGEAIAVDRDGNSYVTGQTGNAATFSPGNPDGISITGLGGHLLFAKYDPNGTLLFARQPPTVAGRETGLGIALDASGASHVTGAFSETATFGPGFVFAADTQGFGDMFLARFATPSNTTPSIEPAPPVTRQQGTSVPWDVTVATVSDTETAAGALAVTAVSVPSGVALGPLRNLNGTITTTVEALCGATTGWNTISLEVTDGTLNVAADVRVDVTANTPPSLGLYPAATIGNGMGATIVPDGSPVDSGSVASLAVSTSSGFAGTVTIDPAGAVSIANAGPVGVHTASVVATDNCGALSITSFTVTVVDVTPPVITSITPSTNRLWPPNHQLLPVSVSVVAVDDVDVAPVCAITDVASNELQDGRGDGNTGSDWLVTGPLTVALRSERSGAGSGRVYSVNVTCTDAAGNTVVGSTAVTVPKSAR